MLSGEARVKSQVSYSRVDRRPMRLEPRRKHFGQRRKPAFQIDFSDMFFFSCLFLARRQADTFSLNKKICFEHLELAPFQINLVPTNWMNSMAVGTVSLPRFLLFWWRVLGNTPLSFKPEPSLILVLKSLRLPLLSKMEGAHKLKVVPQGSALGPVPGIPA